MLGMHTQTRPEVSSERELVLAAGQSSLMDAFEVRAGVAVRNGHGNLKFLVACPDDEPDASARGLPSRVARTASLAVKFSCGFENEFWTRPGNRIAVRILIAGYVMTHRSRMHRPETTPRHS